jgi:hypothetical protein
VKGADRAVEDGEAPDLGRCDGHDGSDQKLLDVLAALRRAVDDEHGRRSRHRVHDADDGLLGDRPASRPAHGEERGTGEREGKCVPVRRLALDRVAREEGDGDSEGRRLGQRQVDEDHPPREHVESQVDVDPGENETGEEGDGEGLDHGPSALASRRTFTSNRAR